MLQKKHNTYFVQRLIYFAVLYLIYTEILYLFGSEYSNLTNLLFFFLMLVNYIFDNLNFKDKKTSLKNIISIFIVNMSLFFIYFLFRKTYAFLYISFVFSVFQNLIYYVANKVTNKNNNKEIILTKTPTLEEVEYFSKLEEAGVRIETEATHIENTEERVDLNSLKDENIRNELILKTMRSTTQKRFKRVLDIGFSLLFFVPCGIIILLVGILVKLESKGKFIFVQDRIGLYGKKFKMYKIRSMYEHNEKEHSKYASEDDKRITKIGKFMRKTRIDELPQIINILKGDMSFIGPRAEWDELHKLYRKEIEFYWLKETIKPGLTGWAQVMFSYGAGVEDAKKKLEYDLYYMKYQNFILDMIIIFKTIKIILFGRGR